MTMIIHVTDLSMDALRSKWVNQVRKAHHEVVDREADPQVEIVEESDVDILEVILLKDAIRFNKKKVSNSAVQTVVVTEKSF